MTQEDDHRDDSGRGPEASDEPASSGGWAAPGSSSGWAAPGQGSPQTPEGQYPQDAAQPGQHTPGFAPPGGSPPSQPSEQAGPGYWQQDHEAPPGYGPPPYGTHRPPGHSAPPPRPGVVPLRPMTLGDLLNGAFGLIRHNPRTTIGLSLIVMAVTSIIGSIGTSAFMTDYTTFLDQVLQDPAAFEADPSLPFRGWALAAMYGGTLLTYAGTTFVTGLLTAVVGLAVLGHKLTPGQAWAAVRERIWQVAGLALLLLAINLGLTLVAFGIPFAGILLGSSLAMTGAEGLGLALTLIFGLGGVILGIALFAWIMIRIYFAMPAVVLERLGPGQALARSWRLTRGSWWRVFGIVLLTMVLVLMVSMLLSFPFSLLGSLSLFLMQDAAWSGVVSGAILYVGDVLIYAITTPFTVAVTTLLYIDLRMRREGLDLKLHTVAQQGRPADAEIYLPEPRT